MVDASTGKNVQGSCWDLLSCFYSPMERFGPLLIGVSLSLVSAWGQPNTDEYFETKVRPLLAGQCYGCHAEMNTAGLRLDSRQALLKGGNHGPAIVPGDPEKSILIQVLRHAHESIKMPPKGPLSKDQVESIADWVREGAYWPEAAKASVRHQEEREPTPEQKSSWAFRPLKAQPGASIDGLVRAALQKKGLAQNPRAAKAVLLRRLSFDLTGLPPAPEETRHFLDDSSPDAVPKLVDRLLASPRFGERWGRYWLDIARYGEDDYTGTQPRPYPNAWRYRDWVIQAFNDDMPYDVFVKAQIAGDLMGGEPYLAGLGLFGLGPWYYSIAAPAQARADERHDRVDVVSRGFLGLTAGCARCHDHKYDPISMKDYYGLAGVFASTQYKEYPLAAKEQVDRYEAAQKRIKQIEKSIEDFRNQQSVELAGLLLHQTARYLTAAWRVYGPAKQDATAVAKDAGLDKELLERWVKHLQKKDLNHPYLKPWQDAAEGDKPRLAAEFQQTVMRIVEEKNALDDENKALVARGKAPKVQGRRTILPGNYVSEEDFNPGADIATKSLDREPYVLWRSLLAPKDGLLRFDGEPIDRFLEGEWRKHLTLLKQELETAKKQSPEPYPFVMGVAEHEFPLDLNLNLRGNPQELGEVVPRRFLAVLSPGKPGELRRGSGRLQLAEVVAAQPLAARVMANRVWQHLFGAGLVRTPSNFGVMGDKPALPDLLDYLAWRFASRQYSIKALIREIVLAGTYQASSAHSAGGATADPENRLWWRANRRRLDAEALRDSMLAAAGTLDGQTGGPSLELDEKNRRRSVYAKVGRYRQEPTLALFDFPSASITAEQRVATNVPLQRLFFLNSEFVMGQAESLAARLSAGPDPSDRIGEAYQLLFARGPSATEVEMGRRFLLSAGADAWKQYAQVLLSSNEFAFLD
ncbi:MAG: PSD1 and planctomycete cytochrome C domain-containing protein [Bryobacteraceae bacterium]